MMFTIFDNVFQTIENVVQSCFKRTAHCNVEEHGLAKLPATQQYERASKPRSCGIRKADSGSTAYRQNGRRDLAHICVVDYSVLSAR